MDSSQQPKTSKWPRRFGYAVLFGLTALIGYLVFLAPKSDGKLLLANGDVFHASQRCLKTGEANLPKNIRDAILASRSEGWLDFRPLAIPVFNTLKTGVGSATLASESTMYFIHPLKGNQHGARFLRALEFEWTVKKCVLFELYASKVFFGKQRFGIEAAAKGFFSKEPANLSIAQAAFLAATTRGPNVYLQPTKFHQTVLYRNKIVDQMEKRGLITKQQAKLAKQEPIQIQ